MTNLETALDEMAGLSQQFTRIGEHWPQGPVPSEVSARLDLAEYLDFARKVDLFALEPLSAHWRLRRLIGSGHSRFRGDHGRGRRLDQLIAGGSSEVPLTWSSDSQITPTLLDQMYAARWIAVPTSRETWTVPVDLSRLLAATDAAFSGASATGLVAESYARCSLESIVSWLGDLATWLLRWNIRRVEAERKGKPWSQAEALHHLDEVQRDEVPLEAVLGGIDGETLAAAYPFILREGLPIYSGVADAIERYYVSPP